MNITQMHLAIQQGVDKINSFQADSLLPEEIDLEINKAISWLKKKVSIFNIKSIDAIIIAWIINNPLNPSIKLVPFMIVKKHKNIKIILAI